MASTLAEKIIARAAGRRVMPGEIVTCKVDLAMIHDSRRPAPGEAAAGGARRRRSGIRRRSSSSSDHYVPAVDDESRRPSSSSRATGFARPASRNFYDMQGICHVVLPERGHLRARHVRGRRRQPLHRPAARSAAYMSGFGATEMTRRDGHRRDLARVPETIRVRLDGRARRRRHGQGHHAVPVRAARAWRTASRPSSIAGPAVERAVDAGAHGADQHGGRARRRDRPGRARRRDAAAIRGGGAGVERPMPCAGAPTPTPAIERTIDSTPPTLAPQVALPHIRRPTPRRSTDCRDSGSIRPISAPASARSSRTCTWPPRC